MYIGICNFKSQNINNLYGYDIEILTDNMIQLLKKSHRDG